jgi:basic membrane protein A
VRAKRVLHIRAKAVAPSPTGADQFVAPFSWLARQHYDLVIGVGYLELGALAETARRYPAQKLALIDATRQDVPGHPKNLEGTIFHTEQPAYLAGYLAAKMARGPRPHVISAVGGWDIPPVEAYIAGFQAGAKRADPKITVLKTFTKTFGPEGPCANAAKAQIDRGSTVVFNVAGTCGLGALRMAQKSGVYGIGVDVDQSNLGDFILTSVVKNLNFGVYDLAKRVVEGRLPTGGNLSYTLANHGVYLGQFSRKVPLSLQRQLIPLARQIRQGRIHVPSTLNQSH